MRRLSASLCVVVLCGCTALADRNVTYADCVPPHGPHYVEDFDGSQQDLLDRCWRSEPMPIEAKVFTADGDLIVRPARGRSWTATTTVDARPVSFVRRMTGDFLVVTKAEASSTLQLDHCVGEQAGAGLVVRRMEPFAWSSLLVRPFFDPGRPRDDACRDEGPTPPPATARASTMGFDGSSQKAVDDVGFDAEAVIALCRLGDELAHYVQGRPQSQPPWIQVHRHRVTTEPLDVGVTAVADPTASGDNLGVEGHFVWIVYDDFTERPQADGCAGALERFAAPVED